MPIQRSRLQRKRKSRLHHLELYYLHRGDGLQRLLFHGTATTKFLKLLQGKRRKTRTSKLIGRNTTSCYNLPQLSLHLFFFRSLLTIRDPISLAEAQLSGIPHSHTTVQSLGCWIFEEGVYHFKLECKNEQVYIKGMIRLDASPFYIVYCLTLVLPQS